MRNLPSVISAMLAVIPQDEYALRRACQRIAVDCFYTAPEAQGDRWREMGVELRPNLGPTLPTEGWRLEVMRIYKGEITP